MSILSHKHQVKFSQWAKNFHNSPTNPNPNPKVGDLTLILTLTLTLTLILTITNYFQFQYTFIPAMDHIFSRIPMVLLFVTSSASIVWLVKYPQRPLEWYQTDRRTDTHTHDEYYNPRPLTGRG